MKKLTIRDIARLANTSRATVSRYLNGIEVKAETKKRIDQVVKETNYHRNSHARMLVTGKTMTVGVVVENIANEFFTSIFKGIEKVAYNNGYRCVYYSWSVNFDNEEDFLSLIPEGQVDALIFVTFNNREKNIFKTLERYDYPIVLIGDSDPNCCVCSVDVDNELGIEKAFSFLKEAGHRDIAYISGPNQIAAVRKRFSSFKRMMTDVNESGQLKIVNSDFSNLSGYFAMKTLLKEFDFTAVISSNDEAAIGAILAIKEAGMDVPKEISIVGFDDIPEANWVNPKLTTIRQPFLEIGVKAANLLFLQMSNSPVEKKIHFIEPKLIVRESVREL